MPSGLWYMYETLDTRYKASGVGAAPIAEWSRVRVGNTGHTLQGIGCGGGPHYRVVYCTCTKHWTHASRHRVWGQPPSPSGLWYVWETLDTRFKASGVGAAPIAEWSMVRVGNIGHMLQGIGAVPVAEWSMALFFRHQTSDKAATSKRLFPLTLCNQ